MKKPNLLVIHTDQHSTWSISAYNANRTTILTPNIDRLADEGAILTNFFTNSAVCTPSRGCFVTGRYPHSHGAIRNNIPLNNDEITFAEVLRQDGYDTGYVGKWHLDGHRRPGWVHPQRCFGFEDNHYMFNRGHWKKIQDKGYDDPDVFNYKIIGDETTYTTDMLKDKTIEFMKRDRDKPFCFMLSIPDPHSPFPVRAPYDTMFDPDEMVLPENFEDPNLVSWASRAYPLEDSDREIKLRKQIALYCGMVKLIDDSVGQILAELENQNILDDTIVVFTADHGDYLGEHGLFGKNQMYEGAYRIPMLIRWPEKIAAGTVCDSLLSTVDFQPTILKLMGSNPCGREQGIDASTALTGGDWCKPDAVQLHHASTELAGIVTDDYLFAYHKNGDAMLFDRKNDHNELNNLAENPEYKGVKQDLLASITKHHIEVKSPSAEWLSVLK